MKNLVRGGVILSLLGMFVALIYAQTQTETAPNIAKNSQIQLNNKIEAKIDSKLDIDQLDQNIETEDDSKADTGKKLVEKTASSKAVGVNKGSFVATAYCLRGKTAMGHGVRSGLIAADPRVLGLGSRINLNAGGYSGTYLVSDTGGKIKGKRLDIWMASCSAARRFGRRNVSVTLLPR